ncbi:type II secretion system protein GspM [Castellaniella defragrans]|uniref:type II secretion system protein GspM n=1 Tax=Castellaniella defragrans TaxID=75697 RepID=UPI0023F57285|nr:type II secretion system protein GspM [Castellaniella defragrans]
MSGPHAQRWRDAWNARARPALGRWHAAWRRLSPRERRLLGLAVLLLGVAVLWLAALRPAIGTLRQAREQLPVLRAQAAELEAVVLESRALGRERRGAMTLEETAAALQESLRRAGLQAHGRFGPVRAADGAMRQPLTVEQAPAARLLAWLAQLPEIARVRVHRLDLARSHVGGRDRPGLLSGSIELALPAGSPP